MKIPNVLVLAAWWSGAYIYCQEENDPCWNFRDIPDLPRRHPNYSLSMGEVSLNDQTNFTEAWYGNVHYRLTTEPPLLGRCGSHYPIWRNLNAAASDQKKALMCIMSGDNPCFVEKNVRVKNCSGFEVYQLKQTKVRLSSYCFEPKSSQAAPAFLTKPRITPAVEHVSSTKSQFLFRCEFSRSLTEAFYYETNWFIDGKPFHKFAPMIWNGTYINSTALTETLLLERGKRAGCHVGSAVCPVTVRARNGPDLPPGGHELSVEYFGGIKIHQSYTPIDLHHGEEAHIRIQSLVPFGCGSSVAHSDCKLSISARHFQASNSLTGACKPGVVVAGSCGIPPITAARLSVTMTVMGQVVDVNDNYDDISRFELIVNSDNLPFFENYTIGQVTVRLRNKTSKAERQRCSLQNEPYLHSFGRRWSRSMKNYYGKEGVFTLYKHTTDPIEVQVQTRNCSIVGPGSCTCGLAVRVGKTLFEISRCKTPIWIREYTRCGTEGEEVEVRRTGTNSYQIHLPTGGWIDVTISIDLLNVYFNPSVRDIGNSAGLCGDLSSDHQGHFVKKDGSSTNDIDVHFSSWRIETHSSSLFMHNAINLKTKYTPNRKYCTCDQPENGTAQITCSALTASTICSNIYEFSTVKPAKCSVVGRKKRRALLRAPSRRKREVVRRWTESEAKAYCDNLYSRSATVDVCRDVPGVDVDRSKQECISDIMISGNTIFANMSIDSVRSPCIHEVAVNSTLQKKDPQKPSKPSVLETVLSRSCPGDCTGRGSCHFGKCVCVHDHGGPDCSVDLNRPPDLYSAEDGGHCDLTTSDCEELTVYGEVFTGSRNATCRIKKYKVTGNGVLEDMTMISTETRDEGMSEMVCLIRPHVRRQVLPTSDAGHVVMAYEISVSNTGDIYSNDVAVMVYDSSCVQIDENTKQWTIKEGFCVDQSRCIPKVAAIKDGKCTDHAIKAASDNILLPLWICVGTVSLAAVLCLLIGIIWCRMRQRRKQTYIVDVLRY
ncbi:von Willebrand factor D and EGF domain-containing protein-like [Haliotis cracherodii]|uniref:von Willebrand factor D and EGF domain-containing protein-like n=1 Tax=Haliotis cracherodii TaxID=6455 RepID=UPI0039EC2FCD